MGLPILANETEVSIPSWLDILFVFCMITLSLYYAFQFTQYGLQHIDRQIHMIQPTNLVATRAIKIIDKKSNGGAHSKQLPSTSADIKTAILEDIDSFEYISLARPLKHRINNRCCCLFPYSPKFFSWSLTVSPRLFLRLWFSLCTLSAVIFWVEFLLNSFLEYIITRVICAEPFWCP